MTAARLWVVGTPIGNLADLSPRAADALRAAAVIACEDSRRTAVLARHVDAHGRLLPVHAHNERERIATVLDLLHAGSDVALVTDAGMPTVSDPGGRLVAAAADAGHVVEVVPGPSAVTTALAACGAPADRFAFAGFVPRKAGERGRWLDTFDATRVTVVAFESPQRLPATLDWLAARDPDRRVAVCRELTKMYEDVATGTAAALAERYAQPPRGEVTLVLWPSGEAADDGALERLVDVLTGAGLGPRAVADAAAALGVASHNAAYTAALDHPSRRAT